MFNIGDIVCFNEYGIKRRYNADIDSVFIIIQIMPQDSEYKEYKIKLIDGPNKGYMSNKQQYFYTYANADELMIRYNVDLGI